MKHKWILIVGFLTMMGWSSAAQAANYSIDILSAEVTCITFPPSPTGYGDPQRGIEFDIEYTYHAGNGAYQWQAGYMYGGGIIDYVTQLSGQGEHSFTGLFGMGPTPFPYHYSLIMRLYSLDTNFDDMNAPVGTILAQVVVADTCTDGSDAPGELNGHPFDPNDGRIHPNAGAPFAAYCVKSGLQVYDIDAESEGHLVMNIPNETLTADAPAENILLDEVTGIRLYRLATGAFQINADLSDGKEYVLTWNGCPEVWSHTATFDGATHPID